MAPKHQFYLLRADEATSKELNYYVNLMYSDENMVELDDLFIDSMRTTFDQIPALNPLSNSQEIGLLYFGISKIEKEGARFLYKALEVWVEQFSKESSNIIKVNNESLKFDKENLLSNLKTLIIYTKRVVDEDYCIIHLGI